MQISRIKLFNKIYIKTSIKHTDTTLLLLLKLFLTADLNNQLLNEAFNTKH